jgi:hypothetical protein
MDSITLSLIDKQQSELLQKLLDKAMNVQSAIISNVNSTEHEAKRARFISECIDLLLQALKKGYTAVNMPGSIMKTVLRELKTILESQLAIMMDLMKDDSLVQDNLVQVITRGIELLGVMHRMTHETLQIEKETV